MHKPGSAKAEQPRTNKWTFAAYIGFFAGFIWGGIKIVENYLLLHRFRPDF